jgi:hypothetical protein
MTVPFELASRIFDNARKFRIHYHRLAEFDPVDELTRESGRWFSALGEEEEGYAKAIRMKVWRLRSTIIHSLLPFGHEDLMLNAQIEALKVEAAYVPFLAERMEKLTKIINFLIDTQVNPKREMVFKLLQSCPNGGQGVGIVCSLTRGPTVGWSEPLLQQVRGIAPGCEFIASIKMLRYGIYQQIILPSSGRLSPLIYILYYGSRTERLDVVVYKREGV